MTGDHYRFVSIWMARSSYLAAAFIMLVFVSINVGVKVFSIIPDFRIMKVSLGIHVLNKQIMLHVASWGCGFEPHRRHCIT